MLLLTVVLVLVFDTVVEGKETFVEPRAMFGFFRVVVLGGLTVALQPSKVQVWLKGGHLPRSLYHSRHFYILKVFSGLSAHLRVDHCA